MSNDYSKEMNDWWKNNYGTEWDGSSMPTKSEGMSMADFQRGTALYRHGQESDKIKGDYDAAVGAADALYDRTVGNAAKTRNSEMAYNGVLYERMKKYMPLQQKRAGMGNMGIAQTGLAQITGDHMNRRSAIQGQYNDAIADASFARATAVGAAERARANSMSDLNALTTEEMMKIYAGEEADAETKQKAAIDAFKNSITSYASAEDALAGLDALGLEATDPEYTALKTQIEGYFRDQALEGIIGNLDNYTDKDAALAALGYVLQPDDPLFAQYATQIEGHFRDKKTSSYNKAKEEIWNYPDSATALAYIATLDTTGWTEQEIEQLKAQAALLDYQSSDEIAAEQENALAAYNSQLAIMMQTNSGDTDAMYALLESFKDRLSPDVYATAKMELDAYKNDPQRQYETKQNEMSRQEYIDGMLMLDAADKAGYSDADEYKEAVIEGEEKIFYDGYSYEVIGNRKGINPNLMIGSKRAEKQIIDMGYKGFKDRTIPNLTLIAIGEGGIIYIDGKWYQVINTGTAPSSDP